jgi:hypothetical protein
MGFASLANGFPSSVVQPVGPENAQNDKNRDSFLALTLQAACAVAVA